MTPDWPLSPGLLTGVVIAAICYVRGWLEQRSSTTAVSPWRHAGFFTGLAALLIALQSPLDVLADHSFTLHQFQHLFLRAIGPLLLMLSVPQALLIAGMPEKLRMRVFAPLLASRAAGVFFGFFAHPFVATFLLLAVPVFWHLPGYHDLSVRNATAHSVMHVTMFVSGMFFFWRVLDPRPAPQGASYGTRIVMSWAAIAGNIPLGAYITLKSAVLYPVYGENGRMLDLSAMADEQLGGVVIWSPGSMVFAVLLVVVIRLWGMQEQQLNRPGQCESAGDAKLSLAMANRRMGWRLAAIAATVGVGVAMVAVLRQFLP
ncbi:MAG: cytochrome c oxidase assembly protein [Burkholderiales bacterium]|nr:cytochrome c oxidase assembly protein [Burkholderiales bacterium]